MSVVVGSQDPPVVEYANATPGNSNSLRSKTPEQPSGEHATCGYGRVSFRILFGLFMTSYMTTFALLRITSDTFRERLPEFKRFLRHDFLVRRLKREVTFIDEFKYDDSKYLFFHKPFSHDNIPYNLHCSAEKKYPNLETAVESYLLIHECQGALDVRFTVEHCPLNLLVYDWPSDIEGAAREHVFNLHTGRKFEANERNINTFLTWIERLKGTAKELSASKTEIEEVGTLEGAPETVPHSCLAKKIAKHLVADLIDALFQTSGSNDCTVDVTVQADPLFSRDHKQNLKRLSKADLVWDRILAAWTVAEPFELECEPNQVVALPLMESGPKDKWPDFQLNLVYAKGESFIECQTNGDEYYMDLLHNFFGCCIDIWDGPINDRFGWYGNAENGTLTRYEPKPLPEIPATNEVLGWLVMPKYMSWDDEYYEEKNVLKFPVRLFADEDKAIAYGKKKLLDAEFAEFTYENSHFSLYDVDDEEADKIKAIMGFEDEENWRAEFEAFALHKSNRSTRWDEIYELLGIRTFQLKVAFLPDQGTLKRLIKATVKGNPTPEETKELVDAFELIEKSEDEG